MRVGNLVGILLAWVLLSVAAYSDEGPEQWRKDIDRFAALDAENPPARNSVLFIGSSSIRRWDTAAAFAGMPTINRGFGGSQYRDLNYYFDRIVAPYEPRTIVIYSGDNDIHRGATCEQVAQEAKQLLDRIRSRWPTCRVVLLAIKPSASRAERQPKFEQANRFLRAMAEEQAATEYCDTFTIMLDDNGELRTALYDTDELHLNAAGYAEWQKQLMPLLKN